MTRAPSLSNPLDPGASEASKPLVQQSLEDQKVLLGFSGGARSQVTAVLLKTQGIDVVGAFVDFEGSPWETRCRAESWSIAEKKAHDLGIPLIRLKAAPLFEAAVVDPFLHQVLHRRTPQTCLNCHSKVLLPLLYQYSRERGIFSIATGHRAWLREGELHQTGASDDQSAWLAFLPRKILERLFIPLGDFSLEQIAKLAREISISESDLEASSQRPQCNLTAADRVAWSRSRLPPGLDSHGPIMLPSSPISIGEHRGIFEYPLGSAVPVPSHASAEAWVALAFELANRSLKLGKTEDSRKLDILVEHVNWIDPTPPETLAYASVEALNVGLYSSSFEKMTGKLFFHLERRGRLVLDRPLEMALHGAPLIFLKGNQILGSGWIA